LLSGGGVLGRVFLLSRKGEGRNRKEARERNQFHQRAFSGKRIGRHRKVVVKD